MIVDAETLPADALPSFDLCIVGAGAAGITLAIALIGSGLRICILESGGPSLERMRQSLADAQAEGQPYFPVIETRARRFGGSTAWWDGECRPLDGAEDLQARPWLGDPGWPSGVPDDLLRYYPRAQELCGLGPEPFDPAQPWLAGVGFAALPLDPSRFVTRIFRYASVLDFAEAFGDQLRDAPDVNVLLHAHVTAIEPSDDGTRATAVMVIRESGPALRVATPLIVLAAGGIENARLLLASGRRGGQPSLGNDHDLVGRFFMEHIFLDDVAQLLPTRPLPELRPYFRRLTVNGRQFKATLAPTAALLQAEGLANFVIKFASSAKRSPGLKGLLTLRDRRRSGRPGPGRWAATRMLLADLPGTAGALARVASGREIGTEAHPLPLLVSVVGEQAPNPASRVTLSERHDRFGQPLALLDWRLAKSDRQLAWWALELLAFEAIRSGLGQLTSPDAEGRLRAAEGLRGGRHHMGTTRMGLLPSQGVVDPDCRVHGVHNLFVAGSSVFPSAGHANPTLTIMALALRLAEFLRQNSHNLLLGS